MKELTLFPMFKKLLAASFFAMFVFGSAIVSTAQDQPASCCFDCTCTLCGDILSCVNQGPFLDPNDCGSGGTGSCGIDLGPEVLCSTYWGNTTLSGADRGDGAPSDCIPIDGGLGLLIAGGLGIGVMGIRRRKEGLQVECD